MSLVDGVFDESERVFSFVGTRYESPALNFDVLTSTRDPFGIVDGGLTNLKHEISISGT
jgi:hypothetical protein